MAISPNRRQRIIEFATPKVADLVVVEIVDASKNLKSADSADHVADTEGNFGQAHPDTRNFPNHKLALIKNADDDQGQFQLWYYVVDRSDQDDYNWEFQSASATSARYDTVTRTYITLRSSYDEASPAITDAMPISTSDPFTSDDGYILYEKRQARSGDEVLDSLYVIDRRTYIKKVPVRNIRTDDTFSYDLDPDTALVDTHASYGAAVDPAYGSLLEKETLYYKSEEIKATTIFATTDSAETAGMKSSVGSVTTAVAFRDPDLTYVSGLDSAGTTNFWGTDELGIEREGKQLSDNWYVLFERQVVPPVNTTSGEGSGEVVLGSYQTSETFTWPAVLRPMDSGDGMQDGVVGYSWKRKKGGKDTVVFPTYKRDTYTGPTKTNRVLTWRKKRWDADLTDLQPMQPLPVDFVTPLIRTSIKPTLHQAMYLGVRTGTEHPVYNNEQVIFNYGQTNYTDWPASLVISDSQRPFRGGFLREKVTVTAPTVSAQDVTYAADPE